MNITATLIRVGMILNLAGELYRVTYTQHVTPGKGVAIHREDCLYLTSIIDKEAESLIDVSWTEIASQNHYLVSLEALWGQFGLNREFLYHKKKPTILKKSSPEDDRYS